MNKFKYFTICLCCICPRLITHAVANFFASNMERHRKYIASMVCHRLNKRIWRYICILVLYFNLAEGLFDGPEPIVETKWGILQGKWSRSVRDRRIANFLGISYALPPVGDLRFKVRRNLRLILICKSVQHPFSSIHIKVSNNKMYKTFL